MVKKLILGTIFLLFIMPLVMAVDTEINVRTLPKHDVFISLMDPANDGEYIKIIKSISGSNGRLTETFSDNEHNSFTIGLLVKKNDKTELSFKKFETYAAGSTIDLEYYPEGYEIPEECDSEHFDLCTTEKECTTATGFWYSDKCNEKECNSDNQNLCTTEETCTEVVGFWYNEICNAEEQITEESTAEAGITGFTLFGGENGKGIFSSTIFWIIGVGLVLLILIIFIMKRAAPPEMKDFKVSNTPKLSQKTPKTKEEVEEELSVAERKIQEAQAEIKKIKNKSKIEEAQKRIKKEQEELERMQRGED
ncbi:MAG: hypothetical protein ABIG28_02090 [archaeon]